MSDPYLYEDCGVLINLANIRDGALLRRVEADISDLAMVGIYAMQFPKYDTATLQEVHRILFGQVYPWAGEFRTIQMKKAEDVLGGDTVRYAYPAEIKDQLSLSMGELCALKRNSGNDRDVIFRLVRLIAQIWQIHPFREGNTRSVIIFAVLFAKSLGFEVDHALFRAHAAYVRNALVWASQGIYSKYEYLERIFYDAILQEDPGGEPNLAEAQNPYEQIGEYQVKKYQERPHQAME